ncbi:hypothetical protein Hanom_Chr04g00319131 [Helianthus anomalus]
MLTYLMKEGCDGESQPFVYQSRCPDYMNVYKNMKFSKNMSKSLKQPFDFLML